MCMPCVDNTCHRPEQELMAALQQHSIYSIGLFQGQALANTIWALAKLQDLPMPPGSQQQQQHQQHQQMLDSMAAPTPATEAAAGGWRECVKALMWRCEPQMLQWSGRDISQAAWGLSKLGARPNWAWRQVGNIRGGDRRGYSSRCWCFLGCVWLCMCLVGG
jgi:hypothetical protein